MKYDIQTTLKSKKHVIVFNKEFKDKDKAFDCFFLVCELYKKIPSLEAGIDTKIELIEEKEIKNIKIAEVNYLNEEEEK